MEWIRLDAGKSDSRIVLGKEESLSSAIFAELESLIRYKRAILTLAMSEGSVLERFGIEVLEKP